MHAVGSKHCRVCLEINSPTSPFISIEMELSKKKTNRYNNYDEISGSNDEVIKSYNLFLCRKVTQEFRLALHPPG